MVLPSRTTKGVWAEIDALKALIDDLGPGGGGSGNVLVQEFPFAYNTPGLLTGAALYIPTIGDILLDAWIEIDTAWNGTSPLGDVGSMLGQPGLFGSMSGWVDMTVADVAPSGLRVGNQVSGLMSVSALSNAGVGTLKVTAAPGNVVPRGFPLGDGGGTLTLGARAVPGKFTTADPIKVCVSQDGTNTGADPGSTQGAAVLYLITATPV